MADQHTGLILDEHPPIDHCTSEKKDDQRPDHDRFAQRRDGEQHRRQPDYRRAVCLHRLTPEGLEKSECTRPVLLCDKCMYVAGRAERDDASAEKKINETEEGGWSTG